MKKLLISLYIYFFYVVAFASSVDGKTITFNQLIEVMQKDAPEPMECCPEKLLDINIRNVKVKFNRETDGWLDKRYKSGGEPIHIKYNINFVDCEFPDLYWYLLGNIEFHGYLRFNNSTKLKAKFKHCTFHKSVWLLGNEVEFMEFLNCDFRHGFKMKRTLVTDRLSFDSCKFNLRTDSFDDFGTALDTKPRLFYVQYRLDPPMNLLIANCQFNLPEELGKKSDIYQVNHGYCVDLNFSNFNNLRFNYNVANVNVVFDRASVTNHFSTHDCLFNKYVFTQHFAINSANSIIQWSTIEGDKIAVFSEDTGEIVHKSTHDLLRDELNFKSLVSSYAIFYTSYKLQGDRVSSNDCYVEWKDIETVYLKHHMEKVQTVDAFFLYYMNVFLDFFCDYGTSPTGAIEMSFYALLIFAVFYFLFPSEQIKERSFIHKIRQYFEYFTNSVGLEQTMLKAEEAKLRDRKYDEFIADIRENRDRLPFYFRLFGKPVYQVDRGLRKVKRVIYRMFDKITGKWEELDNSRKLISGFLYGIIILMSIFYFVLIRAVEALTLSLNAFSTLGFGEIPVKGTVRYLTILEGFIGWFLLSIFSVSMISQILW